MSTFPSYRPRRLRRTSGLRRAFAEAEINPGDMIAPLFLKQDIDRPIPISAMPGHSQHNLESMLKEARELASLGVAGVILFGIPSHKDAQGSQSHAPDGITQVGLRALKDELGDDFVVIADLCLCEYTDHGHCGILKGDRVDNDPTLEVYARIAVAQAEAGADVVAPSGMMDGQVGAIRAALDLAATPRSRSWRTRRSTRRASTGRSVKPLKAPRASAIAAAISRTRRTWTRHCARPRSTCTRGPTR